MQLLIMEDPFRRSSLVSRSPLKAPTETRESVLSVGHSSLVKQRLPVVKQTERHSQNYQTFVEESQFKTQNDFKL